VNIYDIGNKNGFAVKNRVKVFLKDYANLEAYNVDYLAYTPSILYQETKYLLELVFGYDLLRLGSAKYLTTLSLSPRFEYSHTNRLRSITYFKYQQKDFSRIAQNDLDASHYELVYSLQKILSPRSYIQTNIIGILEKKDHDSSRVDVDYTEYRLSVNYANQFTTIYGSEFFAEYRRRDYKDASTLYFGSKRADNAGTIAANVNAKVLETLRLHLKGTYSRVESNQDRYAYQKYTLTFGINKIF